MSDANRRIKNLNEFFTVTKNIKPFPEDIVNNMVIL